METLSELNFDTLAEIINISTRRAAQGLSDAIGKSIQPPVAKIELIKLNDVSISSLQLESKKLGIVTLEFVGKLNAEVMLLFAEENVLHIVQRMMGAEIEIEIVREFENEAMCELGNIMINACLASITDMLKISMESTLPHYAIKSDDEIVEYIRTVPNKEFVLASHIDFSIEGLPMKGKLFFLMNSIK